jgi:hypothetical protein
MIKKCSIKMSILDWVAVVALIVGGINWGLTSKLIFNFNLVEWLFGTAFFTQFVYLLVGISAIYSTIRFIFFRK